MTTIIAGDRGPLGRHRKEPSRGGVGGLRGAAVLVARCTGLTLGPAAVILLVLGHVLGWSALVVRSGSMEPAVPVGSLVLTQRISPQDVRVGDAITVRRTGGSTLSPCSIASSPSANATVVGSPSSRATPTPLPTRSRPRWPSPSIDPPSSSPASVTRSPTYAQPRGRLGSSSSQADCSPSG